MNSNNKNNDLPDFHDRINQETGFKVPNKYFDDFTHKMISKMERELDREVIKISIWDKINNWISNIQVIPKVAISLSSLLLILMIGFNYFSNAPNSELLTMNQQDAMEYIMIHSDELDMEDLSSLDLDGIDIVDNSDEESEEYLNDILDEIDDEMLEELIM